MSYYQFLNTTYREYLDRIKAFNKREEREWERTREIVFFMHVLHPYIKKEHMPKTAQDLWKLPSERNEKVVVRFEKRTEEEKALARAYFAQFGMHLIN